MQRCINRPLRRRAAGFRLSGMKPSHRNPRKAGFTLVELLVVVAIIAILISIIMPQIGGALSNGRRIACASNLRQIAMATHEFADSRDGALPPVREGGWTGPGESWPVFLAPYFGADITVTADIPKVPFYQRICPSWRGRPDLPPAGRATKMGLGMNPFINGLAKSGAGNWQVGAFSYYTVRAPAAALLYGDSVDWHMTLRYATADWWMDSNPANPYGYYSAHPDRHDRKANYAMLDGHVETLKIAEAKLRFLDPAP